MVHIKTSGVPDLAHGLLFTDPCIYHQHSQKLVRENNLDLDSSYSNPL